MQQCKKFAKSDEKLLDEGSKAYIAGVLENPYPIHSRSHRLWYQGYLAIHKKRKMYERIANERFINEQQYKMEL